MAPLAIAVSLAALVAVGCGGSPEPTAEPAAAAAEAPAAAPAAPAAAAAPAFVSITPQGLIQIYLDNDQYQANEMAGAYIDRLLKVDATVRSVSPGADGVAMVTSVGPADDPKDATALHLLFPKAAEGSVSALKAGAKVQASCAIKSVDKTKIQLADCALL